MGELIFEFEPRKAIEVILMLATRLPNPGLHNLTHLLYFADRMSLERYGRFIAGDDYFAMMHGPVPSNTYNLLKEAAGTDKYGFVTEGRCVRPLRGPDLECLSDSDIECLEQALHEYGALGFEQIRDRSHDTAYTTAWDVRGEKLSSRISIESMAAGLEDSDKLLAYLRSTNLE